MSAVASWALIACCTKTPFYLIQRFAALLRIRGKKENLICHLSSMKNGRDTSDLLSLRKKKVKKNHLISSICSIGPENEKNSWRSFSDTLLERLVTCTVYPVSLMILEVIKQKRTLVFPVIHLWNSKSVVVSDSNQYIT